MNKLFYPKLAFMNLKKNHKTYAPYLFTCILTIMLFYALSAIGMNSNGVGDSSYWRILGDFPVLYEQLPH